MIKFWVYYWPQINKNLPETDLNYIIKFSVYNWPEINNILLKNRPELYQVISLELTRDQQSTATAHLHIPEPTSLFKECVIKTLFKVIKIRIQYKYHKNVKSGEHTVKRRKQGKYRVVLVNSRRLSTINTRTHNKQEKYINKWKCQ